MSAHSGRSHRKLAVLGLVALVYSAMGLASLTDALAGTHLASVDRPRSDAAIWGVIGVLIAALLVRWCLRQLRRPAGSAKPGSTSSPE